MAIVEQNKQTKVKLVHLVTGDDGAEKRSTRTYSNIADGVSNDIIMTGMTAIIGLLAAAPASISRVDEVELVNE